ncbi:MAG TPA: sigma-70 family RNA polymerase sigma factor [Thermoanaerobaculia bacterium]|nr:sigma-70 family RNA polymerase sigma factor [Thermoanaerobaculia bacterium]
MAPSPDSTPLADHLGALGDAALVRQVADRRAEALGELYDRFGPLLLGLVVRILGSRAEAEEVLQDVFLLVWNQAGRYDPSRSSVSTWLVLIARSRAIDRLRSRKVVERTLDAVQQQEGPGGGHASPEAAENVLIRERRERVRSELAALPAEQRQVLELAFFQGLSQSEIAGQTGIPLGTVKTRSLLAMKKLRQALRPAIRELL